MPVKPLGEPVAVRREKVRGEWHIYKVDSFGMRIKGQEPFKTPSKTQAMLVEAEMRGEIVENRGTLQRR